MNREQRMAETIAKATADGIEKAQRAPALAAARAEMNDGLRQALANGSPKVTTDTSREGRLRHALDQRDGDGADAPRTGQGIDQGQRGAGKGGPDSRTPGQIFNDNIREQAGRRSES
jgi:hypothetical protein